MSHEGPRHDRAVIRGRGDALQMSPQEKLDAEAQRIVDATWDLYLGVVGCKQGGVPSGLKELDPEDDEQRDIMAQLVEEHVAEVVFAWGGNPDQLPTPANQVLLMAFLGINQDQLPGGDISLRDYCLNRYFAYNRTQSDIMLALSASHALTDTIQLQSAASLKLASAKIIH